MAAAVRPVAADTLRVTFTTTSPGAGGYEPRNVHVAWIETNTGQFVTTIGRWAQNQRDELAQWRASHTDWNTDTDGVSGATQSNYGTYIANWDTTDRGGFVVPNGVYRIRMELTNDNAGANQFNRATFTFNKNGVSSTQGPLSQGGYINVVIEYTAIPVVAPQVVNDPPTQLTGPTAQLNGRVVSDGGEQPAVTVYWGDNDGGTNPGNWDTAVPLGNQPVGAFFTGVTGLTQGTTYYYRCFAQNSGGSAWAPATESFVAAQKFRLVFQEGDVWKYFKGTSFPGATWHSIGFDDTAWLSGPTGIGYGDGDDATVLTDMRNSYFTVYMRYAFTVTDPVNVQTMTFTVDYDDGFVAFINSDEVERRNVAAGQNNNTPANPGHEAGTPQVFDISDHIGSLVPGDNVFAIEVHNTTLGSTDLSMIPELTMDLISAEVQVPDIHLNPGTLAFSPVLAGGQSDLTFDVENTGNAILQVNSLSIVGLDKDAYSLVAPPATPFSVPALTGRQTVTVRFAPAGAQAYEYASVTVGSNDPDEAVTSITLSGQGTGLPVATLPMAGSVGGSANAVVLHGANVLLAQGASLTVLDTANPASPQALGRVRLPDVIRNVVAAGNTAYAAAGPSGLFAIDVATPSAPAALTNIDTPGHAYGVAVAGSVLCVADGNEGVVIFDVSNPAAPAPRSFYLTQGPARAVEIAGTVAYVLDEQLGLQILNVSNPSAPTLLGALNEIEFGQALSVSGTTAYIADRFGGFFVVDVANTTSPSLQGETRLAGTGKSIVVSGPTAYVAVGDAGIEILDVSNPASPTSVGVYDTPGDACGVVLSGTSALVADGGAGLRVVDVSTPATPSEQGAYTLQSAPTDVAWRGALVYAADGTAGLQALDVFAPSMPLSQSVLDTIGDAYSVVVAGTLAYVANGPAGFQIVDVSNPTSPALLGTYPTDGFACGGAVSGSLALAVDGINVYVLNVTNPSAPTLYREIASTGASLGAAVEGLFGYVADGGRGLRILDLSNPATAAVIATYDTPGVAYGVAVSGGVAYVADGTSGLQIVDVSTPSAPSPLGNYDTPGVATDLAVAGTRVYLVDTLCGLEVIDVTNPISPRLREESSAPVRAWAAAVSGSVIAVADDTGGLVILGGTSTAARRFWLYQ